MLRDGFLSDLGGEDRASIAQRELAQRASVLGAMLEDAEARWLKGEPVELPEFCTLVNAQRRVLSDIGLERRQRDATPTLVSVLNAHAAKSQNDAGGGPLDRACANLHQGKHTNFQFLTTPVNLT